MLCVFACLGVCVFVFVACCVQYINKHNKHNTTNTKIKLPSTVNIPRTERKMKQCIVCIVCIVVWGDVVVCSVRAPFHSTHLMYFRFHERLSTGALMQQRVGGKPPPHRHNTQYIHHAINMKSSLVDSFRENKDELLEKHKDFQQVGHHASTTSI